MSTNDPRHCSLLVQEMFVAAAVTPTTSDNKTLQWCSQDAPSHQAQAVWDCCVLLHLCLKVNLLCAEIGKENWPGVGESFRPQLSGTLSNIESQGTQKEEKENRPPPAEAG